MGSWVGGWELFALVLKEAQRENGHFWSPAALPHTHNPKTAPLVHPGAKTSGFA